MNSPPGLETGRQHLGAGVRVGWRFVDPDDPEACLCERSHHGAERPVEEGEVDALAIELVLLGANVSDQFGR